MFVNTDGYQPPYISLRHGRLRLQPHEGPQDRVLIDWLSFKYATMPAGERIFVKELESNLIGSLCVPQYKAAHQSSSPVIRTKYCELEDIGLVSYRSLYMVIQVGKQVLPIVAVYNSRHEWISYVR